MKLSAVLILFSLCCEIQKLTGMSLQPRSFFWCEITPSMRKQRNWVFATNSDFLIPISLDSNLVKPLTFQTMTSVWWNNISLKYQRLTTLGSKDIGIRKSEFVMAKTQLLYELPETVQCLMLRRCYLTIMRNETFLREKNVLRNF